MADFINTPILRHVKEKSAAYEIVRGFAYINHKYHIEVYEGWITDGASVPKIFWNLFSPFAGRYIEAAILHDALYRAEALDRKKCDEIFLEAMSVCKVPRWKRYAMYWGVRLGGWKTWKEHTSNSINEAKKYIEIRRIA